MTKSRKKADLFDLQEFLSSAGASRSIANFKKGQVIFSQDDVCDDVLYIQSGNAKLSIVNPQGKQAVLAIVGPGDFLGEGCIVGNPVRMATATAITPLNATTIEKKEMMRVLHDEKDFAGKFINYMLRRNTKIEADLADQLFNSSEKRLARALLILARYRKEGKAETIVPKMSQETLAELVGTTRTRVNFFMNKFRKLGFIHYNSVGMQIHRSLVNVCCTNNEIANTDSWSKPFLKRPAYPGRGWTSSVRCGLNRLHHSIGDGAYNEGKSKISRGTFGPSS